MVWRPDYITAAELKVEAHVTDAVDDAQFARWATAASRAVDRFCHRQFGALAAPEEREYEGEYWRAKGVWMYAIDDLQDDTDMTVVGCSGTELTDYVLYPRNAVKKGLAFTELRVAAGGEEIVASAPWGWNLGVPSVVKSATLLQGTRFAARRDSPYGVAGSPADGSEMRLLARVDPDVEVMLGLDYRREVWSG